jgi:hypothetical protein
MGCTVWGSNLCRGRKFFSFIKCADCLWGPPSVLFNGYWDSFLGVKQSGCKVNHSPSWIRMNRAIPVLLHGVDREDLIITVTFSLIG